MYIPCGISRVYTWFIPGIYGIESASGSGSTQCSPKSKLPAEFARRSTPLIKCTQIYLFLPPRPPGPFPEARAAAGEVGAAAGRGSGSPAGSAAPAAASGGGPPAGNTGAGSLPLEAGKTGGGWLLRRCFRTRVASCPLAPTIFRKSS